MEIDVSGMLTASSPSWQSVSISETSLNFYLTTRRYIPKDSDLQKKRHFNSSQNFFLTKYDNTGLNDAWSNYLQKEYSTKQMWQKY